MASQGELLPFAREVLDVPVSSELSESFMAYSLSVITSRAIPDVKDGLKPVQRRILYSMREMRLFPDRPHRKCAHVVGDVMAKFHPHGDSAIYDTLVRLGQDFAKPITLIDPQGNFGSLDDPPAAHRYTECRLTPAALHLLAEIEEDTVEWRATYDGETQEPAYLPGLLPNLLVNGTSGIAVGMATNMAPHNLGEVFEAIKLVMKQRRPKPTTADLLKLVPGPDFPSGGTIVADDMETAYETGRGTIRVRAKAEVVKITRARQGIEVTELPYLVGVERVVAKINDLVSKGKIAGISDLKNLSDRKSGMKLVIECKTGIDAELMLEKLYRLTPLEESFGINNVVLVDGVPTTLGLYDLCLHYINHRLDVIVRRSEYRLRKAQERLHLVEGLLIAIDNIDKVIAIIRGSENSSIARQGLMEELELTEVQAEYVLELRLRRLTALAYDELIEEQAELLSSIKELEKILGSEKRRRTMVIKELEEVVEDYKTPRRSKIVGSDDLPDLAELESQVVEAIADTACVISLTTSGIIGREPQGASKSYSPGRHDVIASVVVTTERKKVSAITSSGRVFSVTANDVPAVGGRSRGKPTGDVFAVDRGESVVAIFGPEGDSLLIAANTGMAKRVDRAVLAELKPGRTVMKLADRDSVVAVFEVADSDEIVFVSSDAQALKTPASKISTQGPGAKGVTAIGLKGKAQLLTAAVAEPNSIVVTVTDRGTAKATATEEIPSKGRGAGGLRLTKFKNERRVDFAWVGVNDRMMCVVGTADSPTKPDATPQSLSLRPTRRDGPSKDTKSRILFVGSLRW